MQAQNSKCESLIFRKNSQPFVSKHKPLAKAIALALSISVTGAQAATIAVTSTSDVIGVNGDCTLREAISSANSNTSVDACASGSGFDTIDLSAIADGTVTLTNGVLAFTSEISVAGNNVSISGNNASRVIEIFGYGRNVTLNDVSVINGNTASIGGGINVSSNATLEINRSTISGNTASGNAGYGGGIGVQTGGSVTVNNSTITGNTGFRGGGVGAFNYGGVSIYNSTISSNYASYSGGGVSSSKSSISLLHTTVTGNSIAAGEFHVGAGVYLSVQNYAGNLTLSNSIVANSVGGADCYGHYNYIHYSGVNLIEDQGNCGIPAGPGLITTDPGLMVLADNGGATLTHALPDVSDARNATNGCGDVVRDQRGFTRDGPACDLGAFDFEAIPTQVGPNFVVSSGNDVDDGNCSPLPGHCSLREAANAANHNANVSRLDASTITFTTAAPTVTLEEFHISLFKTTVTIQGGAGSEMSTAIQGDVGITNRLLSATDSNVNLNNLHFAKGNSSGEGGCLNFDASTVTLNNSIVSDCQADLKGGGIFLNNSDFELTNSTITNNISGSQGGGFAQETTIAKILGSTLSNNEAVFGGGFSGDGGSVQLENSTISGNTAVYDGSGLITIYGGVRLINTTISDNTTSDTYLNHYTLDMTNGNLVMANSIIANSIGSIDCKLSTVDVLGDSLGPNLVELPGDACGQLGASPDLIVADPLLGPLADNGGPNFTHAFDSSSPALNAGDNSFVPVGLTFDQRGKSFPRIFNVTVDLGSFELSNIPDLIFSGSFEGEGVPNRPPSFPAVDLTPANPNPSNNLTCTASGSIDPDGDELIFTYRWEKNESPIAETSNVLGASETAALDEIKCEVMVSDGEFFTNWVTSPIRKVVDN